MYCRYGQFILIITLICMIMEKLLNMIKHAELFSDIIKNMSWEDEPVEL